ncbi:MAG TPA: IPTL-CTERM sorting domain-containing protein [Thermoanaerobaculia bacterium]|nr:IPTL-CTERM sorting domain-containing protein [Thermoanaerobaculia bacterium]
MKTFVLSLAAALLLTPLAFAQSADLLTEKTGPAESAPGSDVPYTVTVTNLGPDNATDVTLNDPIPGGMTFVSATQNSGPAFNCVTPAVGDPGSVTCTLASFPAGTSAEFTFVFNIPIATPDGTIFTNIATTTTSSLDENEENNSGVASTMTPPPPSGDLFVLKTGPTNTGAGDDVTFLLTVGNNGPDASTGVSWEDTLPGTATFVSLQQTSGPSMSCTTPAVGAGGTVSCSLATLDEGDVTTFELTVNIPGDTPAGTGFTNTINASSETTDPFEENNSATHTVTVQAADMAVDKSGPASANAGDDLTYTITVTNNGPDFTAYTFQDVVPPNTTVVSFLQTTGASASCSAPPPGGTGTVNCNGGLSGGASAVFQLVVEVGNTTSVVNTATVNGDAFDPDTSNNSDSVTTTITPVADLAVVKSGPANITAGANISYTLSVTNNGPSTASSVSLTDTLPANTTFASMLQNSGPTFSCSTPPDGGTGTITCTIASLAPAATATFTFVFHVNSSTASGTPLTNIADVSSSTSDPDNSDNSSSTTAAVATSADVRVVKSGPTGTSPGLNTTYTIAVANDGPSDAANVTLNDILPPEVTFVSLTQNSGPTFNCVTPASGANGTVTCTLASFVAGAGANFTLVVQVIPATPFGGTITNTATISTTTTDPDGSDNSSSTTANVTSLADVRVTKTGATVIHAGETTSYTITVTNDGPTAAQNVELSDPLPANTTFVSFAQDSGPVFACATPAVGSTGTVTCTIASLANATSATFTLTVAVNADATGTVSNTATATSTNDPTPGNNSGTAAVAIAGANIPTLSTWGLMLLAAALGLIVVLKR